jgi:hypothetical protein
MASDEAYDRPMAEGTEDLDVDAALARLMEGQGATHDEPQVIHRPQAPPGADDPSREVARLREDLDRVLNLVLDEVEAHTSRVDRRLAEMGELVEAQADSAEGARRTVAGFDETLADLRALINKRIDTLAASVADVAARPVPPPELVLDDRFTLLARTIEGHFDATQLDLGPVEARLASLADAVSAQAQDIAQLREMIHWMQERLLVDVHFSGLERDHPKPDLPRLHS